MFTKREQTKILNNGISCYTRLDAQPMEETLPQKALAILQKEAGIHGTVLDLRANLRNQLDARIELRFNGNRRYEYLAECRPVIDRKASIGQIKTRLQDLPSRGLLITPYLSADMAEQCRALDLEFIDAAGNAYLNAPGLYVFIKGQKARGDQTAGGLVRGSGNPTAQRMIFALLAEPDLLKAPYRQLAEKAGIALGAVGGVFRDLAERGFITASDRARGRTLLEPGRLLDEWVANYPVILRPKLKPRKFRAPDPAWWQQLNVTELDASWGSEIAAERLTNYLRAQTQTLYVSPSAMKRSLQKLVSVYRLRPDPQGPIEILETFWHPSMNARHPDLVPPILVYADLIATLDPRNLEAAHMILKKDIGYASPAR